MSGYLILAGSVLFFAASVVSIWRAARWVERDRMPGADPNSAEWRDPRECTGCGIVYYTSGHRPGCPWWAERVDAFLAPFDPAPNVDRMRRFMLGESIAAPGRPWSPGAGRQTGEAGADGVRDGRTPDGPQRGAFTAEQE